MPHLTSDDQTQLHYRIIGNGSQTAVLVHGWMTSGAVFDGLIELLAGDDVRLIVPDLRGSGDSAPSKSGYGTERHARDILAIADHAGAQRFALVGHSMGGQIAQWIAAAAPERLTGLALVCAVPASGVPLPDDAQALFRTSGQDEGKQGTILDLACKQLAPEDRARLLKDAARISSECIQESFEVWRQGGFADRLKDIAAPTLVLGTDDPFLPPAFLRSVMVEPIANARFVHLPGPGHYPQVERPRETAAVLGAFLAGLQH